MFTNLLDRLLGPRRFALRIDAPNGAVRTVRFRSLRRMHRYAARLTALQAGREVFAERPEPDTPAADRKPELKLAA